MIQRDTIIGTEEVPWRSKWTDGRKVRPHTLIALEHSSPVGLPVRPDTRPRRLSFHDAAAPSPFRQSRLSRGGELATPVEKPSSVTPIQRQRKPHRETGDRRSHHACGKRHGCPGSVET